MLVATNPCLEGMGQRVCAACLLQGPVLVTGGGWPHEPAAQALSAECGRCMIQSGMRQTMTASMQVQAEGSWGLSVAGGVRLLVGRIVSFLLLLFPIIITIIMKVYTGARCRRPPGSGRAVQAEDGKLQLAVYVLSTTVARC